MKKKYLVIILMILVIIPIMSVTKDHKIGYKELYNDITAYDTNAEGNTMTTKKYILLINREEINKFNNENFAKVNLKIHNNKAELFLQITSTDTIVDSYRIISIIKEGNSLTVKLKKNGEALVEYDSEFNGVYSWMCVAEIDKWFLSKDMKIKIEKNDN